MERKVKEDIASCVRSCSEGDMAAWLGPGECLRTGAGMKPGDSREGMGNNFLSGPKSRTKYPTAHSPASAECALRPPVAQRGQCRPCWAWVNQTCVILRVFMKITETYNFRLPRGKWNNKNPIITQKRQERRKGETKQAWTVERMQ